jgi:Na+/H+ antiporter NhaC
MQLTALVLLPPLLVLTLAMITRRLQLSLVAGLIFSSLVAKQFNPLDALMLLCNRLYDQVSSTDNMHAYLFLLCVGIIITLINHTGAAYALAQLALTRIKNKKQVERSAFGLSLILALDDYLNSLTVGYVMQPLVDSFHIARTKLAYLVHTFAGPVVMLVPLSTWAAFITSQLEQSGISASPGAGIKIVADPFYVYIESIPFIYYAIFTIFTAFIIINRSLSFGPMAQFEREALQSKNSSGSSKTVVIKNNSTISDLLIPLGTLFACVFFGILYMGDYWLFGGAQSFMGAFRTNKDALFVLGISSLITLFVGFALAYMRKQITYKDIPKLMWEGTLLMESAILLVILASTLGSILRLDLETGNYLASLLLHSMHITYLPLIFFLVAAMTSFMIGTAWGTIALLLPIGIPMAQSLMQISFFGCAPELCNDTLVCIVPAIGAILAGATFGDHTSPIAAAIVMSATSSGCSPIDHLNTQFPYTIAPLIGSAAAFLMTGLLIGSSKWIVLSSSLVIGFVATCIVLYLCNTLLARKEQAQ